MLALHSPQDSVICTGAVAAFQKRELASPRAAAYLSMQARAHMLLKTKELELRTAKEDAQAEHAAELATAQQELATVSGHLTQARGCLTCLAIKPKLSPLYVWSRGSYIDCKSQLADSVAFDCRQARLSKRDVCCRQGGMLR